MGGGQIGTRRAPRRVRTRTIVLAAVGALAVAAGGVGGVLVARSGDSGGADPRVAEVLPSTVPTLPAPSPVLGPDAGGPLPSAQGVAAALGPLLADPRLGGQVAVSVVDMKTGAVLMERDPNRLVTPASTTKITTALAALKALPAEHRFTTKLVAGSTPGEVVLVGGGDPTLTAAPRGRPGAYPDAARLQQLAEALKGAKVRSVVVDAGLFSGPARHPTWKPEDIPGGFVAPITALMVDGGRIEPGKRARSIQPHIDAGRKFAALVGLPPSAVHVGTAPAGAEVLAQVSSAPLVRIVETMLTTSDNVLAEVLGRHVALARDQQASFEGTAGTVRDVLESLGLDVSAERLVDASGLSDQDRLSAALLTDALRTAASPDHPELHALFPGLPIAGYDGTLADRYRTGPAATSAGMVRAKTGTLDHVGSLAGVVQDADGQLLAFAFMADRVPLGGALGAREALDLAASALAHCGCR